jgi:hypothetical protein
MECAGCGEIVSDDYAGERFFDCVTR